MLYLGLVAGVTAGNLAAHAAGADAFRVFVATLILIPPALAGARVLYVGSHWEHYRSRKERVWDRREGGMAMYGGMPVMILLSIPLLAALKVGIGVFWDVASFTIMTGIVFAKIGCLLNGCCAGRPSRLPRRAPAECSGRMGNSNSGAVPGGGLGCHGPGHRHRLLRHAALPRRPVPGRGHTLRRRPVGIRIVARTGTGSELSDDWRTFSLLTVIGSVAILVIRWPR